MVVKDREDAEKRSKILSPLFSLSLDVLSFFFLPSEKPTGLLCSFLCLILRVVGLSIVCFHSSGFCNYEGGVVKIEKEEPTTPRLPAALD